MQSPDPFSSYTFYVSWDLGWSDSPLINKAVKRQLFPISTFMSCCNCQAWNRQDQIFRREVLNLILFEMLTSVSRSVVEGPSPPSLCSPKMRSWARSALLTGRLFTQDKTRREALRSQQALGDVTAGHPLCCPSGEEESSCLHWQRPQPGPEGLSSSLWFTRDFQTVLGQGPCILEEKEAADWN